MFIDIVCLEGKEKLKLKGLFLVVFIEVRNREKKEVDFDSFKYMCFLCFVILMDMFIFVVVSICGYVFCKKCVDKFVVLDKICLVCNNFCKFKNLIILEKGGIGFVGYDENLEVKVFKYVGSGIGMGFVCFIIKL